MRDTRKEYDVNQPYCAVCEKVIRRCELIGRLKPHFVVVKEKERSIYYHNWCAPEEVLKHIESNTVSPPWKITDCGILPL